MVAALSRCKSSWAVDAVQSTRNVLVAENF